LWFDIPFVVNSPAASATAVLQTSLTAAALALRPFTIVRTYVEWQCLSDQSAASETFIGNVGFAVVSDQAVAIGITALPTPATDLGSDLWLLIRQWIGRFDFIGTGTANQDLGSRLIDSRAMRKVEDGQDCVQVVEAGIGGSGVAIKTVGRQLIKLH